jgi:pimeloyl-ACP methyl ester carboxylesterase
LILVGSEDSLTPVAEAEALRDGIRKARMRVIEGAGHLSNMESPREFNAALIEFIDSLKH